MTKAHNYKESKNRYYIDQRRVSKDKFQDSKERSNRIKQQFRYSNGTIGAKIVPEAKEIQREIRREVERPTPKPTHFLIRGIARPKSKTDARTPELESDHIVETSDRIGNIDEQESMLNQKYPNWVHFDTYIEEVA